MIDWGLVLFFLPGVPVFLVTYPSFLIFAECRWSDLPIDDGTFVVAAIFAALCSVAWFVTIPAVALLIPSHLIYLKIRKGANDVTN